MLRNKKRKKKPTDLKIEMPITQFTEISQKIVSSKNPHTIDIKPEKTPKDNGKSENSYFFEAMRDLKIFF